MNARPDAGDIGGSGGADAWRTELAELVTLAFDAYTTKEAGAGWAPMALTRTPAGDIGLAAASTADERATESLISRLQQEAEAAELRATAIVTELGDTGVLVVADHELAPRVVGYVRPVTRNDDGSIELGVPEEVNADTWAVFPR